MKHCPNSTCRSPLSDTAKFCPKCGSDVGVISTPKPPPIFQKPIEQSAQIEMPNERVDSASSGFQKADTSSNSSGSDLEQVADVKSNKGIYIGVVLAMLVMFGITVNSGVFDSAAPDRPAADARPASAPKKSAKPSANQLPIPDRPASDALSHSAPLRPASPAAPSSTPKKWYEE